MPWGVDVADAVVEGGAFGAFALFELSRGVRLVVESLDVGCDELALVIDKTPLAAVGLDQSGDEQIVSFGMEDVEEQVGPAVAPVEFFLVDERNRDVETGGVDDHVDFRFAAVGEADAVAAELFHVGFDLDVAVGDVVGELRVDDRVGLEKFVVGGGETDFAEVAQRQVGDADAHPAAEEQRKPPAEQGFAYLIERETTPKLGEKVIPAAHAVVSTSCMLAAFDGDVATGVARADHEHAASFQDFRRFVFGGVKFEAVELAGYFRPAGIPVVAVGDDDAAVAAGYGLWRCKRRAAVGDDTARFGYSYVPTAFGGAFDSFDLRVELDRVVKVEVLGVAP